ncbi:MAG: exosortase E/protease, VPEID-CTERM system [Deltaproteobacteria bacterium]|nr:exosortase E/protease, VPEID-CTERM system [Deltaproteobacteria bacterium]
MVFGRRFGRVLVVALILVLEWATISWVFDARTLAQPGGPFDILRGAGDAVPLVAVMAFASLLVRRRVPSPPPQEGHSAEGNQAAVVGPVVDSEVAPASPPPSRRWVVAGAVFHIASFAAFIALTSAADRSASWVLTHPTLTLVLWLAAAAGLLMGLVLATWTPAQLSALARRPRWRDVMFVLGLTVGAWIVAGICRDLWVPLRASTMAAVEAVLAMGGVEVISDPVTGMLGTHRFLVDIAPVCSGLQGIGLLLVLVIGHLWHQREQLALRRAWLLVPIAVALGFMLNVGRIAALIAIGHFISPAVAVGGFHAKAGWVLLCAAAVGLVLAVERNRWFHDAATSVQPARPTDAPAQPYLLPMVAGLGGALVLALMVADSAGALALPPLKIIAATVALGWLWKLLPVRSWPHDPFAVIVGIAVTAMWLGLRSFHLGGFEPPEEAMADPWSGTAALWTTMRLAGAVVISPLIEELAFRGYLARRLIASRFERVDPRGLKLLAIVGSSVAFGLLHQAWLAATLAGVAYALVYRRRGRLSDAVLAHAVTNAGLVVLGTLTGDPAMWLT